VVLELVVLPLLEDEDDDEDDAELLEVLELDEELDRSSSSWSSTPPHAAVSVTPATVAKTALSRFIIPPRCSRNG